MSKFGYLQASILTETYFSDSVTRPNLVELVKRVVEDELDYYPTTGAVERSIDTCINHGWIKWTGTEENEYILTPAGKQKLQDEGILDEDEAEGHCSGCSDCTCGTVDIETINAAGEPTIVVNVAVREDPGYYLSTEVGDLLIAVLSDISDRVQNNETFITLIGILQASKQ